MAVKFTYEKVTYDSGNSYYEVGATWDGEFSNDPLLSEAWLKEALIEPHAFHPFRETCDWEQAGYSGKCEGIDREAQFALREWSDIVAINPVTTALCEMLSNEQLIIDGSGNTCPYGYRTRLMAILSMLWD